MDAELRAAIAEINHLARNYDALVSAWNTVRSQLYYLQDAAGHVVAGIEDRGALYDSESEYTELRKAVRGDEF
jgi:hypothetical protein